jgi:acylphosphatase
MAAKRLIIAGRVQGVGFRDWLISRAEAAGLSGWVRNRLDGTVEALIAGETAAVEELVRQCRRGPRLAVVTSIEEEFSEAPDEPGFLGLPDF